MVDEETDVCFDWGGVKGIVLSRITEQDKEDKSLILEDEKHRPS